MTEVVTPPAATDPDPAIAAAQAEVDAVEAAKVADPATVVPETYTLALPQDSKLDPAIVERTAADARALGLSNEAGQKLLDLRVKDLTDQQTAAETSVKALEAAWTPKTGEQWIARNVELKAQALADPEIGGSEDKLAANVVLAEGALAKFGSPKLMELLNKEGLLSHPEAIRFLAKIGKASSEPKEIVTGPASTPAPKSIAEQMYGPDGTGLKKAE